MSGAAIHHEVCLLPPAGAVGPLSIELFSGAGGLALGISKAGFPHAAVVENGREACQTLKTNYGPLTASPWPIVEADVRTIDWRAMRGKIALLAAGAPCQPFSLAGCGKGADDPRNLFPETIRAVRDVRPMAVLVENVSGLMREAFAPYFRYVTAYLGRPHEQPRSGEAWQDHAQRLASSPASTSPEDTYRVSSILVNAANHGVPQLRRRVFIVALRNDLSSDFEAPKPTHSLEALLWSQRYGDYWTRHKRSRRISGVPARYRPLFESMSKADPPPLTGWATVRDAIRRLPTPNQKYAAGGFANHVAITGARVYRGHTGNDIDWPAKTVKAGVHGCPGGEHIVVQANGKHRYLTVRECARLQAFPDSVIFPGSRTASMKQLGNAVPVTLAEAFGAALHSWVGQHLAVGLDATRNA